MLLHACFGLPRFRCPFTSSINAFFRTLSSSLLTTCPCHNTPFIFAVLSNISSKPSIFINSSLFFLSTNFTAHIDLGMALSVLSKIAISISLKHHLHIIWKWWRYSSARLFGSYFGFGTCYCNSTVNNRVENQSPAFRVDLVRKGSTKLENCNLVSADVHFLLLAINFLVW